MTKAKIGVVIVAVLLALYLAFTVQRGWIMITQPDLVARGLGIALLGLPIIGAWALIVELMFGARVERLGRTLGAEGGLPADDLPRSPGGRIDRAAADEQFERFRGEADAAPDDWRSWYRLGLAYDASGDRKRARHAMRRAIALERGGRVPA